ncbi:MAG: glycosyltransferase [Flavobacteriaceae bacterium]|nr:MAG: glycosyltransferase [Flavobacteriaceae bacterium]
MHILIVHNAVIPVKLYGGTERIIWYLGKELARLKHKVTYLVKKGSSCDFGTVIPIDESKEIWEQIPRGIDVIHFQEQIKNIEKVKTPYVITIHGNTNEQFHYDKNVIFVSKNHANRYNSDSFVYNGLDWDDYSKPTFSKKEYFHFLGHAAWRVKNVQGAIKTVTATRQEKIKIIGGVRFNINMGLRFTFSSRASFYGMVGGQRKNELLDTSKGLVFPVRWHEPFGLAITESLFYGCPVFGTPYGSLPELITDDFGFLSNKRKELTNAIEHAHEFSHKKCHEYALEKFNSQKMALEYLNKYERVMLGEFLNAKKPQLKEVQTKKKLDWFE